MVLQSLRFDSNTPEEWIIMVGLVQKVQVERYVITTPTM